MYVIPKLPKGAVSEFLRLMDSSDVELHFSLREAERAQTRLVLDMQHETARIMDLRAIQETVGLAVEELSVKDVTILSHLILELALQRMLERDEEAEEERRELRRHSRK